MLTASPRHTPRRTPRPQSGWSAANTLKAMSSWRRRCGRRRLHGNHRAKTAILERPPVHPHRRPWIIVGHAQSLPSRRPGADNRRSRAEPPRVGGGGPSYECHTTPPRHLACKGVTQWSPQRGRPIRGARRRCSTRTPPPRALPQDPLVPPLPPNAAPDVDALSTFSSSNGPESTPISHNFGPFLRRPYIKDRVWSDH